MRKRMVFFVSLALMLLAMNLGVTQAASLQLDGAGASFPYPIYSKWFDAYRQVDPSVQINYQSIGSGGGIRQISGQTVDFGATDAPMSDTAMSELERPILHIPTVIGSVSIVYNIPGIPSGLKLTGDILADIYLGTITHWNHERITAINPDTSLPGLAIAVARRSDGSGTTFTFSDYLSTVNQNWNDTVGTGSALRWPVGLGARGNEGVAGLVRQLPGAIGYAEQAYAEQNNLAQAALLNKAGYFVLPSLHGASLAAAGIEMPDDYRVSIVNADGSEAYPIATFTWLLVYENAYDEQKGEKLAQFLWWAIHEGAEMARELQYAPLPLPVVEKLVVTLKKLHYNGRPLLP